MFCTYVKVKVLLLFELTAAKNARNLTFSSVSRFPCAFAAALFICLSAATHV